ncbi:putative interleukin-20 receptor subunit alpha-like [Scophthalmus maximus]|uniref:Putative interleukin-20 receptor subunit alpha-like n=1 Tax=Scophthalmus maximus TaxID=52904 RepID=A0A2U9CTD4_SCOMX|nr:putative interleukin-20 receptor subunit alpha-like [Scophthalmus maximus]
MWTVLMFLSLWVVHCAVSSSPPGPISVVFSSVNLRNILQWAPGNGTSEDTRFTVQYAIYGDSEEGSKGRRVNWRSVRQCTDITRCWCDLSNETWDQDHGYHARVRAAGRRASSKWGLPQRRFDPKSDTSLGPPLVSVEVAGNNAIIALKGPMRYDPNNHTAEVSMATVYPQMTYNLSIRNVARGQTHNFQVVSSPYKYQLMPETEYCFSAKTRLVSMPIQCQPSAWQCFTTPQDPGTVQLQWVVWVFVVPSLCICVLMVVGYFLHNYLMGKGQKRPYTLSPSSFHPPLPNFPPENLNIILISVMKDVSPLVADGAISDHACHKKNIADPPPRYSPQRAERPPEPDDSSVDYGFVGVAAEISGGGGEEAGERRRDGEDGNNRIVEHQKCIAGESYEKKVWMVADGPSAGVYSPQTKSYLSQTSTLACTQTHRPIHSQTQMSRLVQTQAWPQSESVSLSQIQGSSPSDQGGSDDDRECPGLFVNKTPHTGLFHLPSNLQTKKKVGMEEEMEERVRVGTNGKVDGGESETVALLSAYASQNVTDMSSSHTNQSDFLTDDYGVQSPATAHSIEEGEEEDDDGEEEEGTICINWDSATRKLFPEMAMELNKEGGCGGLMRGEEGIEGRMAGEEVHAAEGKLKLENVYVRQASEEEAEAVALRKVEQGGQTGWEGDDIMTKWNVVISMDP